MGADEEGGAEGEAAPSAAASYDYLLSMPIYSLTHEKVQTLQAEAATQSSHVAYLKATNAKTMWGSDLDDFLKVGGLRVAGGWLVEYGWRVVGLLLSMGGCWLVGRIRVAVGWSVRDRW